MKTYLKIHVKLTMIMAFAFILIGMWIDQGYAEGENSQTNSPPKVEPKTEKQDPYAGLEPKDKALFQALGKKGSTTVLEDVKTAIEDGASVNARATRQLTPLMVAIRAGPEVVKYLIEKGADVNAKDSAGNTALFFAKKKNNEEILKLLQDAGATE